jgi:hypothetical protein
LAKLAAHHFDRISNPLRENILDFYAGHSLPVATGKKRADEQAVPANLSLLKSQSIPPVLVP